MVGLILKQAISHLKFSAIMYIAKYEEIDAVKPDKSGIKMSL